MCAPPSIVFAAGGTGGHIYPALAVAQTIRESGGGTALRFICSDRAVDAHIMGRSGEAWSPIAAKPFSLRPRALVRFVRHWGRSLRDCRALVRGADALVVTGGFVSAPAARAAKVEGVPLVLVNLDSVPGKASRLVARWADVAMTASDSDATPALWERTGPIVRPALLRESDPSACRRELGLDPTTPTLLVTGGSQGAKTLNEAMLAVLERDPAVFEGWQVLHQAGEGDNTIARLLEAYEKAGVPGAVTPYIAAMDAAWCAADAAVTRAGAGAVAEAWATRTPALFLPYPFHADNHQAVNAKALVDAHAAEIIADRNDAERTAGELAPALRRVLRDEGVRSGMRGGYQSLGAADGAQRVAQRVLKLISASTG